MIREPDSDPAVEVSLSPVSDPDSLLPFLYHTLELGAIKLPTSSPELLSSRLRRLVRKTQDPELQRIKMIPSLFRPDSELWLIHTPRKDSP